MKFKRIVTLGEVMLRLKSPGFERFFQSPMLEATFGGGEGNVAASLANYGLAASFVTALPQNPIGDSAVRSLRSSGGGYLLDCPAGCPDGDLFPGSGCQPAAIQRGL